MNGGNSMKLGKIVTFILLAIPSTKAVGMQDKAFEDRRKQLHSMTQKDLRGELALICEKIDQNKMILDNDAISLVEEMFTRCECGLNNDHSLDSIRANILAVEAVLSFQINASGKSIIPTSEYTYEHANFGFPDAAVTEDSNGSNIAVEGRIGPGNFIISNKKTKRLDIRNYPNKTGIN